VFQHLLLFVVHSERYRPTGMLIHRQNSYAPRTSRREPVNKGKNLPVFANYSVHSVKLTRTTYTPF
jgi:hypothetical protein